MPITANGVSTRNWSQRIAKFVGIGLKMPCKPKKSRLGPLSEAKA